MGRLVWRKNEAVRAEARCSVTGREQLALDHDMHT